MFNYLNLLSVWRKNRDLVRYAAIYIEKGWDAEVGEKANVFYTAVEHQDTAKKSVHQRTNLSLMSAKAKG